MITAMTNKKNTYYRRQDNLKDKMFAIAVRDKK